jgi:hypothetical protein
MAFSRSQAKSLVRAVLSADSLATAADIIRKTALELPRGRYADDGWDEDNNCTWFRFVPNAWRETALRFADDLENDRVTFSVFTEGNSKLPFYSFSVLPEFTCPGAGDCLRFCYSFTAWRYPAAFFRQLQNTLFLRFAKRHVVSAWRSIPQNRVVRLYVDGDIDSRETLAFWCRQLSTRPDLSAYGYSKSFEVFNAWHADGLTIPENYMVNLSSGSKYAGTDVETTFSKLPVVRGEFVVVPLPRGFAKGFDRFDDPKYHAAIRESARKITGNNRVFSCTGKCGDCLPRGRHACGDKPMRGVLVAIGEHN